MKIIALLCVPIILVAGIIFNVSPEPTYDSVKEPSPASELTDLKSSDFCANLRDYKNHKVDSLGMDIYYQQVQLQTKVSVGYVLSCRWIYGW